MAAYDNRIRALAPAFGCGGLFADGRHAAAHPPVVRAFWERHWEPAALGLRIEAPVCYLNGTNDFFGDPLVAERLLASLRVPVVRSYLPNVDHSLGAGQTALAKAWMRWHLLEGPDLPAAPDPQALECVEPSDSIWWADAEGPSIHRCWLPGLPPRDQPVFVFGSRALSGGAVLSSPIRLVEATEDGESAAPLGVVPRLVPVGLGWRWELGSTRHFANDAHAFAPTFADQPWVVTPARPQSDEVVVVLLHLSPRAMGALPGNIALELGWSAAPEGAVVTVEIHARAPTAGIHRMTCPWRAGGVSLRLADAATLPSGFKWAEAGRLQISACQPRQPFMVGPLRVRQ